MNIQWTCMAGFGPTAWNPGNAPIEMPIIRHPRRPNTLQPVKNHKMPHRIAELRSKERASDAMPVHLISKGGSK